LALHYHREGNYEGAETLYRRALDVLESSFGPEQIDLAKILSSLTSLYLTLDKPDAAEQVALRRLAIVEKHFGSEHLDVAEPLSELSLIYFVKGDYERSEAYQ